MNYHIYQNNTLFKLTSKELMQWIFNEKLTSLTQIQKSTKQHWQNLEDMPEWNFFNNPNIKNKKWIMLKKDSQLKFKKKGPYSTNQICQFLVMGLCFSWDFVWTKNFKEWKRISLVSDFSTHPAHTIEDAITQQNRLYKSPIINQTVCYSRFQN